MISQEGLHDIDVVEVAFTEITQTLKKSNLNIDSIKHALEKRISTLSPELKRLMKLTKPDDWLSLGFVLFLFGFGYTGMRDRNFLDHVLQALSKPLTPEQIDQQSAETTILRDIESQVNSLKEFIENLPPDSFSLFIDAQFNHMGLFSDSSQDQIYTIKEPNAKNFGKLQLFLTQTLTDRTSGLPFKLDHLQVVLTYPNAENTYVTTVTTSFASSFEDEKKQYTQSWQIAFYSTDLAQSLQPAGSSLLQVPVAIITADTGKTPRFIAASTNSRDEVLQTLQSAVQLPGYYQASLTPLIQTVQGEARGPTH